MASRPCSCSSREKSSGTSPSEHTSPALFTYQNRPLTPAECGGWHAQGQKHCLWVFCVMSVIAVGGTDLFQNWKPKKKRLNQSVGRAHNMTFNVVGAVAELQAKNVINWSAGVQRVGVPVVADESILPPQDQHGPVDQFQSEPLVLTWWRMTARWWRRTSGSKGGDSDSKWKQHEKIKKTRESYQLPVESLTANSCPFFLVQIYFPLFAFSATLWPSHSTENMVSADLQGHTREFK